MSQFAKCGVPLLAASAVIGLATAAVIADATAAPRSYPVHILTTTAGVKLQQTYDGRTISVRIVGSNARPADGTYNLTNGGAIKVQGGHVVWDAFGVVERAKQRGLSYQVDPTG